MSMIRSIIITFALSAIMMVPTVEAQEVDTTSIFKIKGLTCFQKQKKKEKTS